MKVDRRTVEPLQTASEERSSSLSSQSSLVSFLRSFRWAFEGLGHAWRTQRNFRIHCVISSAVVVVGLWLGLPAAQWATIVVCIGLVLAAELLNTALEAIVDLVSPTHHPLAKIAKDGAAAAVLCLALASVVVGLLLLGPPILMRVTYFVSQR